MCCPVLCVALPMSRAAWRIDVFWGIGWWWCCCQQFACQYAVPFVKSTSPELVICFLGGWFIYIGHFQTAIPSLLERF